VIARLIEQQQIGCRKQRRRQRHAHTPAAGERGQRPGLCFVIETKAGQDLGRARRRRLRADIGQPRMDLGDAMGIVGMLGLDQQGGAFAVGGEHEIERRVIAVRHFLGDGADAGTRADGNLTVIGADFAGDQSQQGRFADAVASDQTDGLSVGNRRRGAVEQGTLADTVREIVDMQHGGEGLPGRRASAQCLSAVSAIGC
jgi:hypothetical protein